MTLKLIGSEGAQTFELREGTSLIVGRAFGSDIPIFDPTISRRHAELRPGDGGVQVRDLGSSNGTYVNGARVEASLATAGDVLRFGKIEFRVEHVAEPAPVTRDATPPGAAFDGTIIRQRPVRDSRSTLPVTIRVAHPGMPRPQEEPHERTEKKLALLLEVSKGLSRALDTDAILDNIAGFVFQIMDVDRVAILLADGDGALLPKVARDRRGGALGKTVPQSIARKVLEEKVAVLSDNAPEDQRFGGQSIVMQSVRSAMCAPLIGSEDVAQGILYVDNLTSTHRFNDDDLEFLIAFSGIAAIAIENSRFAERSRREALVRSNFERYFAPNLAARIASAPDEVKLGGDKRRVAVLFSDIRGFTTLSESMTPDDVASLLSEYFTVMVECVFRHGGTLDKFIGDAIMAQWGAPIGTPEDPERALAAALDMMRELEVLNAKWERERRPRLEIGIGLNLGEVFAGNIGSERRLEFTVIGDAVNIASRLCSAAEGGEILLTDELRRALSEPLPLREQASLELRGKSQPVRVFSIAL
ncbi:MAG: adenylate/guanylate cyclase domain-containing protein [Gemmatimonadaceae bacterium]